MDVVWSTDTVPPRDRVAAWTETLSSQILPVRTQLAQTDSFHGEFRLCSFGPTAFLRVRSRRQTICRGPEEIGDSDGAYLFVSTMIQGTGYLHHAGGVETVPRGAVTFVDGDQPFVLEFRHDFAYVSALALRRDMLALLPSACSAHGMVIPAPAGPALGAFLAALEPSMGVADDTPRGDENRLYDHFLGLAAAALVPMAARTPTPDEILLARIKTHLVSALDAETATEEVAARFNLSPRKLQRLFRAEATTPTLWIRRQRLERCARDFRDPRQNGRTVTSIASDWGFDDMTYFSRCFRKAFGRSPSAYRRIGGAPDDGMAP